MKQTKISISRDALIDLLGSGNFLKVDKKLVSLYGPVTALVLTNLIDFYKYLKAINKLEKNEWFYCTHKEQQDHLNISLDVVRNSKKILIQDNILNVTRKGLPAKEWYFINFDVMADKLGKLSNLETTSNAKFQVIGQTDDLSYGQGDDLVSGNPMTIYKEYTNKEHTNSNSIPSKRNTDDVDTINIFNNTTKEINIPSTNTKITPELFNKFWLLYPKKINKGDAFTSWNKLCKKLNGERPTWIQIRKAVNLQIDSEQWQQDNQKWIPNASTWLNNNKWMNDPKEMITYKRTNNSITTSNRSRSDTTPKMKYKE